jgi:hypothetical protein
MCGVCMRMCVYVQSCMSLYVRPVPKMGKPADHSGSLLRSICPHHVCHVYDV